MPMKMDVRWPVRTLKMEPGNDPTGDQTTLHSESGGVRSDRGSFDRGQGWHEGADTGEGVERATLFYVRRKRTRERVERYEGRGGSFTPVPETPAVGPRAGVRPRVTDGGSEGMKSKEEDGESYGDPHTAPAVGIKAGVRPLGEDGGGRRTGS